MTNQNDTNLSEEDNRDHSITQELYDELKAELEAEKAGSGEAVAQATQPLSDRIALLETELSAKDEELTGLKTQAEEKDQELASLQASLDGAVAEYRGLVVSSNNLFTEDMLQGASIDEIKASVEKANALVGKVREGLENEKTRTTVPAGAPTRTPVDASGMSAREKINYGLEQSRKQGD